jgi:hypothetical protein
VNETLRYDINLLLGFFEKSFSTLNFDTKNHNEIKEYFKNEKELEKLKNIIMIYDNVLQKMVDYNKFLKNYRKIPKVPQELSSLIETTFKNHKSNIRKFNLIAGLIS